MGKRVLAFVLCLSLIITAGTLPMQTEQVKADTGDAEDSAGLKNISNMETYAIGDVVDSGTCGDNVTWTVTAVSGGYKLSIDGTGEMADYDTTDNNSHWYYDYSWKIVSATISNSVTSIGANAFYECENLTSITIPNSVISIGRFAFFECTKLTNITIPKSVTSIGGRAFYETKWLENQRAQNPLVIINGILIDGKTCEGKITIPNSVTSIGEGALLGCEGLTSITIPNSVTSIGANAFYYCEGLTSITIPNSVTSIGEDAFVGCGLTSITIPDSVTSIGKSAFSDCESLTSITIPNSVTSIGDWAFSGCESLTSITIPNSVTSIGEGAFYYCESLKNITVPGRVTSIGAYTFGECVGLTSITIPNSVMSIEYEAFYDCESLRSVTIPDSVMYFGHRVFSGCDSLERIMVEKGNPTYDSRDNCNAIIEKKTNTLIAGCKKTKIPDGITSIGDDAFWGCTNLTSIIISSGVVSIDEGAFDGCSSLTSITIPNSVMYIGYSAFEDCPNLVIYGYSGSYAEKYAKENKIPFSSIGTGGSEETCSHPTTIIQNKKTPTCTVNGYSGDTVCRDCGRVITKGTTINAPGHSNVTSTTKATIKKSGEVITKCKNCGTVISKKTVSYPKTITLSKSSYIYSGREQKPSVTVRGADGKVIAASNYTMMYSKDCKVIRKKAVTITFKGNYSGSISKPFYIVPKGTNFNKLTGASRSFTVKWNKQTRFTNGYELTYSTNSNFSGAKTINIPKNTTVTGKVKNLKAKQKYYVKVRAYKTIGKIKVYSWWSKVKTVTTKK